MATLTLMQRQSQKIRNLHRLGEIKDAQKGLDTLQRELNEAMGKVLKAHGLKMSNLRVSLNVNSGQPGYMGGDGLGGYLNASITAE